MSRVLADPTDRKMLDVVHVQVVGYVGTSDHFNVVEPRRELTKHRSHLPSCQVGTKAEVMSVPECQMEVGVTGDIELVWIDERCFIAVRRWIEQDHGLACTDEGAGQLEVSNGRSCKLNDR